MGCHRNGEAVRLLVVLHFEIWRNVLRGTTSRDHKVVWKRYTDTFESQCFLPLMGLILSFSNCSRRHLVFM